MTSSTETTVEEVAAGTKGREKRRKGRDQAFLTKLANRLLRWPSITVDLSRAKHRWIVLALGVFVVVALIGAFEVFHWTESTEFCGELCHVMDPLMVRYERSSHSNVECAECHVGPGIDYYVRAKIQGTRELYLLLTNTFERPIRSPVHNLRPAREICEECHSPSSYRDNIIKVINHFDDDEYNTPVQSTIILKMGGWRESTGISEGIHWHITNPVYYIAADEQRQVIVWVGAEQPDGSLREYYLRDMLGMNWEEYVADAEENHELRELDCIDCHNRAAHLIPEPTELVDEALAEGLISRALPYVRARAVDILSGRYESDEESQAAIEGLAYYYQTEYPSVYSNQRPEIEEAVAELLWIDSITRFPEMELDWSTNPNNERHNPFPGCFRCHDGKHVAVDEAGNETEVISAKCNLCHTVPIVGRGDDILFEAPVIVGDVPETHTDFRWTIEHREVEEEEEEECYVCHGTGFCNNSVCHELDHPPDMMFTHPDAYQQVEDEICYVCHQDVLCSRCHSGGIVGNP